MAHTRKDEARALDAAELELVGRSHQPEIQALGDDELRELLKLVRERRDRAQAIARQQRREMRRKSEPRGAAPAERDTGSRRKVEVLAMAVRRLNSERERRQRLTARAELVVNAQRALALRRAADGAETDGRPADRTASQGMRAKPSGRRQQITRPMEVGRVSQFVKNAQARRDG